MKDKMGTSFVSRVGFLAHRRGYKTSGNNGWYAKIRRQPKKDNLTWLRENVDPKYVNFLYKRRSNAYYGSWRFSVEHQWHKIDNGLKI